MIIEYIEKYLDKFDPITLILLIVIWYNINAKIETKFNELDKRLTVIETILLLENRLPNHIAESLKHDHTT